MHYRKEIDGLRALAVLPVIFFHAGFDNFSGGFIGVDVFFVISGYLITSIILKDLETGKFNLSDFYERRARRILPALFFVMAVCIPFSWVLLMPSDLKDFANSIIAATTFSSNILFWRESGYFSTASELKPLLHTWSLGVEEQFYILFPLFLIATWKLGRHRIKESFIILFILSLALAQWAAYNKPTAGFFLLPTRGWELMIGSLSAVYLRHNHTDVSRGVAQCASLLGLGLIVLSVFLFDKSTPFPSIYALVPTLGAALIILFAKEGLWVNQILSKKYLVSTGLASYSAYLFHQPLFAFFRYFNTEEISVSSMLLLCFITILLSFISLRFIESPYRNKEKYTKRNIFVFCSYISLLMVSLGIFSRLASQGGEYEMAKLLTQSPAIFAANIDERRFNKYRLELETLEPDYVISGSSRVLQISEKLVRGKSLNLGMSGATLEDIVAILDLATMHATPNTIFIGADPWLFNEVAGPRWKTLENDYLRAYQKIQTFKVNSNIAIRDFGDRDVTEPSGFERAIMGLHDVVNISIKPAADDEPAIRAKIRKDGSRVYDNRNANLSMLEIEEGFDSILNYSLGEYRFDEDRLILFSDLLDYYTKDFDVILILSPYHPLMYSRIRNEQPIITNMEIKFREIAIGKGIPIVGSYNPDVAGCSENEFIDGMHPRSSCMEKFILTPMN